MNEYLKREQQQQLPNISRLSGVWGDLDVHDLTPMSTRYIERSIVTDPQKTFLKNKIFWKHFANKANEHRNHVNSIKKSRTLSLQHWMLRI